MNQGSVHKSVGMRSYEGRDEVKRTVEQHIFEKL